MNVPLPPSSPLTPSSCVALQLVSLCYLMHRLSTASTCDLRLEYETLENHEFRPLFKLVSHAEALCLTLSGRTLVAGIHRLPPFRFR